MNTENQTQKSETSHLAGYALLASAFVLAGLLFVQIGRQTQIEPAAYGEGMVNTHNGTSILSAEAGNGEALWFLDPENEAVIIYNIKATRKLIEPQAVLRLADTFSRNRDKSTDKRAR